MGTRHLIMAVKGGQTRLAQYGQWDGYPSGQGVKILSFLRSGPNRKKLSQALDKASFLTESQLSKAYKDVGVVGDYLTSEQVKAFDKKLSLLSRDHGANILSLLINDPNPQLVNSESFAGDSLFCEWAYVIDFDKNQFELYRGFNLVPLETEDRFFGTKREPKSKYYPVKLVTYWSFDELPTKPEFFQNLADR
jgi:hypothetical protein